MDVVFYRGDPRLPGASTLGTVNISLAGHAALTVSLPGLFSFAEGEMYTACIDPGQTAPDANRNNNCLTQPVSAFSTDLRVTTTDITITPVGANVGETITVTARVRNTINVPASAVLRLWQGHPLAPQSKRLGQTQVSMPASGAAAASWTLPRPEGDTNLWVAADNVLPRERFAADNLGSRNVFLKAVIDTRRRYASYTMSSMPAVADLFQNGQPVMVFGESLSVNNSFVPEGHLTALELRSDGTTRELWSKVPQPAPSEVIAPAIADLDNDGSAEIIAQVVHDPNPIPLGPGVPGEMYIYVFDRNGNVKWSHMWRSFPVATCNRIYTAGSPIIGDMNGDGYADITVIEREIVILDGRTGNEIVHRPWATPTSCPSDAHGVVADIDNDGRNELVVSETGVHVVNPDGSVRWTRPVRGDDFALIDVEGDGSAEIVIPVHRNRFEILNPRTGAILKHVSSFPPFAGTIAATTSLLPTGLPAIIGSQNDFRPATAAFDGALNQLWFKNPTVTNTSDNPMTIVLADVLGHGRPQIISRSDRRFIRIQDIRDGTYLFDSSIYGKSTVNFMPPAVVDADGDGRGEIIVPYGGDWMFSNTKNEFEPAYPSAQFLVFGSVHWGKMSTTWNQQYFNQGEVDQRLAWRGDYQPWKTHNTWRQQPVRPACDLDGDFDVDSTDISLLNALRGTAVQPGDRRDVDRDGLITVADARACTLKCSIRNCAVIQPSARILSLEPRSVFAGETKTVLIRGEYLGLDRSLTTASFGTGVSVGGAPPGSPGPVTVLDANSARAVVTVMAGSTGERTLTMITGSRQAVRPNALTVSVGNRPPVVSAGEDTSILLPDPVRLTGSASDDGLPGPMTFSWQSITGPGTVTFSSPSSLSTSAAFSGPGFYQLRLTVSDGELFSISDIGVRVVQPNLPPVVSAGADFVVSAPGVSVAINGSVRDDGKPFGGLSSQWQKVVGPGTATFSAPTSPVTNVVFSAVGTYILRLTATDTEFAGSDDVTIAVGSADAKLLSVNPGLGSPGQTIQRLQIVGQGVLFEQGNVTLSLGDGIAVGGALPGAFGPVQVVNPTTLAADVVIQAGAQLGARAAAVRMGPQLVTRNAGFTVAAGSPNQAVSVRVIVSTDFVEPGGSVRVSAEALDAAGNVIATPASNFTIFVSPAGPTSGNAPVVQLPLVHFPKIQKQRINRNPDVDPTGRFAFTPRTDPNFGKETGGVYNITAQLTGTTLTGTTAVLVMPNGTHELTARGIAYNTRLVEVLEHLRSAFTARDAARIDAAKSAMAQLRLNKDWDAEMLKLNRADLPPDGGLPSVEAVRSRGLGGGSGDAAFGLRVDALRAAIATAKSRLAGLNVTPGDTAPDLTALESAVAALDKAVADFQATAPSTLAVRQQSDKLNLLLTVDAPGLLDVIRKKTSDLVEQAPPPPAPLKAAAIRTALSAEAWLEIVTRVLGAVTNFGGALKKSQIQGGIHLVNMVVNLGLTAMINASAPPGMYIESVHASSSFMIACPCFTDTYVGATGLNPDPTRNVIMLVGCINDSALTSLLTLKDPSKFFDEVSGANAVGLFLWTNSVWKILKSYEDWTSWAAKLTPDLIRPGPFGVWPLEAVSRLGWPAVNRSRLPCSGVVIVINLDTGAFKAENHTFLKECGGYSCPVN